MAESTSIDGRGIDDVELGDVNDAAARARIIETLPVKRSGLRLKPEENTP
jgi:hypothetical protein